MKQSVNFSDFCDAFRQAGRNDSFSYEGKRILFDWIELFEEDTGTEIELDVIALCCEYSESTVDEVIDYYDIDVSECEDDDEKAEVVEEYLEYNTTLCGVTPAGDFVYMDF